MSTTLMKKAKSLTTSVFNWEDSYFGGYERVVYDHPHIHIPQEIGYDFKNTTGMSWYVADKLCRLLLLKISKHSLFTTFLKDCEKREKITFTGEKITVYDINKYCQSVCIKAVVRDDREMANLFKHFTKFLSGVDYFIAVPAKDDKGSGGGSGEPKTDEESLYQCLAEVEVRTPVWAGSTNSVSGTLKEKTTFKVIKKESAPCYYSPEVVRQANALVNLLDISFEPKEDKIENLLSGKMSPHKISSAMAGDTHIYHKTEPDVSTRPFSVCVLGDESGSMRGCRNDQRQNELFRILYHAFSQIMPPQKLFFYGHSGGHEPEVRVYHELYNPNFEYTIDKQLHQNYGENYDGPVIENVYERVRTQTSDNIIFISISDGAPSGHRYGGPKAIEEMKRVIEKCKRDGFVTVGIGLHYGSVKDIYSYHTIVHDSAKLVKQVSSLINRVVKTEFKD